MNDEVCKICNGNDFIYLEDDVVEQCPLCTHLGKLDEPQKGIPNETRTETLYSSNS